MQREDNGKVTRAGTVEMRSLCFREEKGEAL